MSMEQKAFLRLCKEHAANVQAFLDAGDRMVVTMAKVTAAIESDRNEPLSGGHLYRKADAAAALMEQAYSAVRNLFEPD